MPVVTGTRLGPYEVREPIGRGAMGVVYKAWHQALARPAAVKVLQALAPDPDGSLVTITAHNLPAQQQGTIALAGSGRQIATFRADGKGDVAQDVRIPLDVNGQIGLQLCWGGSCRLSASVNVRRTSG